MPDPSRRTQGIVAAIAVFFAVAFIANLFARPSRSVTTMSLLLTRQPDGSIAAVSYLTGPGTRVSFVHESAGRTVHWRHSASIVRATPSGVPDPRPFTAEERSLIAEFAGSAQGQTIGARGRVAPPFKLAAAERLRSSWVDPLALLRSMGPAVLIGMIAALLAWFLVLPRLFFRHPPGTCATCGYPRGPGTICPECGIKLFNPG